MIIQKSNMQVTFIHHFKLLAIIHIEFIGHIGSDATLKELENATVINFSVVVNETYKDQNCLKQSKTKWIDCEIWNRPKLHPYLKKGVLLFIKGNPEVSAYLPKDSTEPKVVQACRVDEIHFLSKKEGDEEPNEQLKPGILSKELHYSGSLDI
jgi:single-strand DNA-binding protein